MGVKKVQPAATFGHPYGMNSTSPDQFLKSHAQEPLLPERKLHIQECLSSHKPCHSYYIHSTRNVQLAWATACHTPLQTIFMRCSVLAPHGQWVLLDLPAWVCSSQTLYREDADKSCSASED